MKLERAKKLLYKANYHYRKLAFALNELHNKEIIHYTNYQEESPCASLAESEIRYQRTTQAAISKMVHLEVRSEYWSKTRRKKRIK